MSLATRRSASARWSRWRDLVGALGAADDRAEPVARRPGRRRGRADRGSPAPRRRRAGRPTARAAPGIATASSGRPSGRTASAASPGPSPSRMPGSGAAAASGPGRPRAPASCRGCRSDAGRSTQADRSSRRAPRRRTARGVRRSPRASQTATRWWPYASRTAWTAASSASSASSVGVDQAGERRRDVRSSRWRSASSGSAGAGVRPRAALAAGEPGGGGRVDACAGRPTRRLAGGRDAVGGAGLGRGQEALEVTQPVAAVAARVDPVVAQPAGVAPGPDRVRMHAKQPGGLGDRQGRIRGSGGREVGTVS